MTVSDLGFERSRLRRLARPHTCLLTAVPHAPPQVSDVWGEMSAGDVLARKRTKRGITDADTLKEYAATAQPWP